MASTITITGIQSIDQEDRALLSIKINYNQNDYDWKIFLPNNISNIDSYVSSIQSKLEQIIDKKELEWQNLDPKTKTIQDADGTLIVVPINKDEIVRPDIPDYYALRRNEYPPIAEQLDAVWKGPQSNEYKNIQQKILDVKLKYPKDILVSNLQNEKQSRIQYISIARDNALNSLTTTYDGDVWDARESDSTRLANVLSMIEQANKLGIPTPSTVDWRTYNDQTRSLSLSKLIQLGASMFQAQQIIWVKQANLKDQIQNASTIEEVNSIIW